MTATPAAPPPFMGLLPSKLMKGIAAMGDDAEPMVCASFEEVFSNQWTTDAHFVCYAPSFGIEHVEGGFPRCKKSALSSIRAQGVDLVSTIFAIDYDNPGHRDWSSGESFDEFLVRLHDAEERCPAAARFNLLYQTRHGARLVYILAAPLPVDRAEKHHRGLVSQLIAAGIGVDAKCSDWTRCFRAPFVLRDGKATWDDATNPVETIWQPEYRLDAATLPALESNDRDGQEYGDIEVCDDPIPDEADALAQCWIAGDVGGKMTDWMKRAKRQLAGRACFSCIFEHAPIANTGARDTTIQQFVGQAVGCLVGGANTKDTTEARVYGLFLPAVKQLEPDQQTPDWLRVLWDKTKRLMALQRAKEEIIAAKEAEVAVVKEADSRSLMERVIAGMREWCNHPTLLDTSNNNTAAIEWASKRMIVSVGNTYYVMGTNGRYNTKSLGSHQVVPYIKRTGMDTIIGVDLFIDGVGVKAMPLPDIMHAHGTIVDDVILTPRQHIGGVVEGMDTPEAVLRISAFRRRDDLTPTFNTGVDQWLRHLFGAQYDLGTKWIAWSLAFDEGAIAALAIKGQQGCGKKMLVMGLAECLVRAEVADYADLASPYQYGLLTSPFLSVNEGESIPNVGQGPYHQFRKLVSADPIRANRKNQHPISIRVPYRIIFTSNNDDVVANLVGKGNLSPEDREALTIRLIHMDVGDDASIWLRSQGGLEFTAKPGARWIAGDGGVASDFVVAKHFLWLYENRARMGPVGKRFLVEGNAGADIMFKLRTTGGSAPLVIETLLGMVEAATMPPGMGVEEDRLFVLSHAITDHFRTTLASKTRETLTDAMVMAALKGLCVRQDNPPRTLSTRQKQGRVRWIEVDCESLLAVAERHGHVCTKLLDLTEKQRAKYGSAAK